MRQINGTKVPDDMYNVAKAVSSRGGKVFLSLPDVTVPGCGNCRGSGNVILQIFTGGPSEGSLSGVTTYHDGKWYAVKTTSYECPVCRVK